MIAVGTPAVDVDCGIPPRWRRRRTGPLTPEGVQRGGPHRGPAASRFIPLLVGRGLGAKAPSCGLYVFVRERRGVVQLQWVNGVAGRRSRPKGSDVDVANQAWNSLAENPDSAATCLHPDDDPIIQPLCAWLRS